MIVGTAEILVRANTAGFKEDLRKGSEPAFSGMRRDAEVAGADAGRGLRSGVRGETGKLADDLEKDGARSGSRFASGMSGGLGKLASALSATGLPVGNLTAGLEKSGAAAEKAGTHSGGLASSLGAMAGPALAVGTALTGLGAAGVAVGLHMQSATAAIAAAQGTSTEAAAKIGEAFGSTAGKSEFSSVQMARAFATVAGQLKATEGHALNAAQAMSVMTAADDLATAKQIDLGTATQTIAGVMQAFQLKTKDAGHASDVLFAASTATGQSVGALAGQLEKAHSRLGQTGGSIGDLSALLVDMTQQGITGRAAMSALNSGMNTLQKTAGGVTTAVQSQKAAYDQMSPQLKRLSDEYSHGTITSAQYTKAAKDLPPAQAALAKSFATASTAVQTAQAKYRELGVTVFDSRGKFVGMGSIIDQLHPKFAAMTQQQQLAAAATLFGSGAARQMTTVIDAGSSAYQKASANVNRMGSAHDAAAKQSKTLAVEVKTLEATATDLAAKIGAVLIPVVTSMVGAILNATRFVMDHKAVLIALAAVVTGVLGTAIAVFTINKMAAFAESFTKAGSNLMSFGGKLAGLIPGLGAAGAETAALGVEAEGAAVGVDTLGASADAAGGGFDVMAIAAAAFDAVPVVALVVGIVAAIAALVFGIYELVTHWKAVWHAIEDAVSAAFGAIKSVTSGLVSSIVSFFSKLPAQLFAFFTHIVNDITGIWAHVKTLASDVVTAIVGFFSKLPGQLLAFLQKIAANFVATYAGLLSGAGKLIVGIVGFFASLPGRAITAAGSIVSGVGGLFSKIAGAAQSLIGNIVGFFASLPGKAINAVGSIVGDFLNLGKKIVTSIVHGIEAAPGALVHAIEGLIPGGGVIGSAVKAIGGLFHGAAGGLITRPTLMVAGEAGDEVLIPLSQIGGGAVLDPSGVTTPLKVGTPATMFRPQVAHAASGVPGLTGSQDGVAAQLMSIFRAAGLSRAGAAGIVGNWVQESSLNPQEPGGKLAQWGGSRLAQLTREYGPNPTVAQQGSFALQELRGMPGLLAMLRTTKDPRAAALAISNQYERPAAWAANNPHRESAAAAVFSAYGGMAPTSAASAGLSPAQRIAQERGALNVRIARERADAAHRIAGLRGELRGTTSTTYTTGRGGQVTAHTHHTPPSAEQRTSVNAQIAAIKSGLAIEIAQQRAALGHQTAAQSAELKRQTGDQKAGTSVLNRMLTAIHTGGVKSLQSALWSAHQAGLSNIERRLDHDHSAALAALSKQLVQVHKQAQAALVKATKEAALTAWDKAATAFLTKSATDVTRVATDQAKVIADDTKVFLDKQAEAGLSGAALTAAQAQTSLDQITETNDKAIQEAQTNVDAVAGGTALQQAQAGMQLAQAQAAATIQEAQAQAILDKANAAATAAANAASAAGATATNPAPVDTSSLGAASPSTPPVANFTFNITGQNMTAGQLMSEVGWTLKTGSLPIAA